jgi:multiple sugar transport system substrate-binding protein
MQVRAVILAAALVLVPLGARAADLVVWWEEEFAPGEDDAVREIITAFEHKTGKKVELRFASMNDLPAKTFAAVESGRPPDFAFGALVSDYVGRWAYEGRLVDLAATLGPLTAELDRDALTQATLLDGTTGRRGLYGLPMTRDTNNLHVWRSLLERAGFTLEDIPKEWEPFWSFWCDRVQPAVRKALGREDVWGVGLPMSALGNDTLMEFMQFVWGYEGDYVTRDGKLVIDEPEVRQKLVQAMISYTAIYKKGCTPPDAIDWDNRSNNKAFLEQRVVTTANLSLSITIVLRAERPEDYYKNTATILWPNNADGRPLTIAGASDHALVFKAGGHTALAEKFVHFLIAEGWLAHWISFAGDRDLPPMPALLQQPFWLDPGDQHRMTSAIQSLTRPHGYPYEAVSGEWRHTRVNQENRLSR